MDIDNSTWRFFRCSRYDASKSGLFNFNCIFQSNLDIKINIRRVGTFVAFQLSERSKKLQGDQDLRLFLDTTWYYSYSPNLRVGNNSPMGLLPCPSIRLRHTLKKGYNSWLFTPLSLQNVKNSHSFGWANWTLQGVITISPQKFLNA